MNSSLERFDSEKWNYHVVRQVVVDYSSDCRKRHTQWTDERRRVVVDWIKSVCIDENLNNIVYFCAILYIDLYLDCSDSAPTVLSKSVRESDITIQTLGTACLFIATLLHAPADQEYDVCAYDASSTVEKVQKAAVTIMSTLGSQLYCYSTVYDFLRCFGVREDASNTLAPKQRALDCTNNLALFYLDCAALEECIWMRFSHSTVSTACYALALREKCDFVSLALATHLAVDDIMSCCRAIFASLCSAVEQSSSVEVKNATALKSVYAEWRPDIEGSQVPQIVKQPVSIHMRKAHVQKSNHEEDEAKPANVKRKRKSCETCLCDSVVETQSCKSQHSLMKNNRAIFRTSQVFENNFRTTKLLGTGVYGKVYECMPICNKDCNDNRDDVGNNDDVEKRQEKIERVKQLGTTEAVAVKHFMEDVTNAEVLREIYLLSAMVHPNVIRATQVFIDTRSEKLFECRIVMPLIDGPSLLKHLKETVSGMHSERARMFSHQLCKAVAYLHENNILHRDIKPENIVLDRELKTLTLVDFSVSRVYNDFDRKDIDCVKTTSEHVGNTDCKNNKKKKKKTDEGLLTQRSLTTLWYRPPELLSKSSCRHFKSLDLWSMGCVVTEMITGSTLFAGDSEFDQLRRVIECLGAPKQEEKPFLETSFLVHVNHFSCSSTVEKSLKHRGVVEADVVDLISGWLCYIPENRLSASKSLKHCYFEKCDGMTKKIKHTVTV